MSGVWKRSHSRTSEAPPDERGGNRYSSAYRHCATLRLYHVGRNPIRTTWYGIVLPALLINYAGQTALLLDHPILGGNPFLKLAPGWAIFPLVLLATGATIIASQAIITGSFSLTRQAMQLGWLPSLRIRQTSEEEYGQIVSIRPRPQANGV